MDPQRPASFDHRVERLATGRTYHFVDQRPTAYDPAINPTLLCVHGFPDLWYGWRYQIGPWTRNGYRVLVPDMPGYGGTDKLADTAEYSTKKLSGDLVALLDLLGIGKAVLIGHDWGSYIAGRFALWHPDRLLALIMISIPFTPPSPEYIPVEEIARRFPHLSYQAYFANPKSTSEIDTNLRVFLGAAFASPIVVSETWRDAANSVDVTILNATEFEYYYSQLEQGMQGPLSYYRTNKVRFDEEKAANLSSTLPSNLPVLFLWGTADPMVTSVLVHRASKFIPRLQIIPFEGKGHWLMVECKQEMAETVSKWLNSITLMKANL